VNAVGQTPGLARLVKRLGGVAPERDLPVFAAQPFTRWWRDQPGRPTALAGTARRGPVLLWPDTFTNAFHPGVARAAVQVLTDAGFDVRVPDAPVCCGLTWVSTGQLGTARRVLRRTLRVMRDDVRAGVPLVGLEPSCTAMFRADGPELLDGDEDMRRLSAQTYTLAGLLGEKAPDWDPPTVNAHALRQTHCHQHAVLGSDPDLSLLRRAGVDTEQLAAGCCGLAGNFGFERGHYAVSRAAGERVLLPRVRDADVRAVVLADGFSCRTQIAQGDTGRTAVHLAELLAAGLRGQQLGDHPERVIARRAGTKT
jgi:Fe-S oxidoreductase